MKERFETVTSTCVPLPLENVDTDQIIPARFLKATTRDGFGDLLFYDWRYGKDGTPDPGFVLNQRRHKGIILVTGKNFGSGSSREHAAWAIAGYGFKAIVSSFFADIFKNNALNNGLLPVVVSPVFLAETLSLLQDYPEAMLTIDLPQQTIHSHLSGRVESFEINPFRKECLINGHDDIERLLTRKDIIEAYERRL
ncbi:MAG: 3-isopropylmalate dehydratase small subunit [Tannerellaceae bacterium]|nr:3-isopropylmalate dehydratase small subunit [Tannerellaceae bacterium]